MKKVLLGCLVFFVIGFLLLLVGCGAIMMNMPKDGAKIAPVADSGTAATPVKKLKIRDQFVIDDIAYVVLLTDEMPKIGDKSAESGAKWLLVSYLLKNISKEPKTIATDPFKLRTLDGTVYEPDSDGQTAMLMTGVQKQDMILAQLGPKIQKDRIAVFQIPKEIKSKDLTLVVSSDNMFSGTEPVEVQLK